MVAEPPATAPGTTRSQRVRATTAWAVALVAWSLVIGIPNDTIGVTAWLWLGTVAWNAGAGRDEHLQFWRDWWPYLLALVVYWFLRGLADHTFVPVHYTFPIRFDEWLFGGTTPTELAQQHWCAADPCLKTTPPRWWDTAFTTVYASHFLVALSIAAVLWVRAREEWRRWMRRFVAINLIGLSIYFVYPMAPPWMAARDGYLGDVRRITSRGWSEIDLGRQNLVLHGMGNKVAAMPSLHAGIAFLVAFYAVWRLHSAWRFLVLLYPIAMSTALVYFAEHYVVDAIAGSLVAILAIAGCGWWERRRGRAQVPDGSPPS
ncbi:phosphatase PAP2 family protein [Nocardioides sp. SYSU D00038]|uniref:phosphatase PAP2 family protein n=1 Tax=Nocardioides sp. SYSU D00038 TaxID=2812554 RepID=UPI0019672F8A|nr:phosphatase PAP2 family protein [Nocardioides sp. SYSU D00038]